MYCPNCSQQQISEEMRFCSRCGFSLGIVKELLTSGGARVESDLQAQSSQPSSMHCSVRRATWIMLACLPLFLFVLLMIAVDDDFAVLLLIPLLAFLFGFFLLLYGVFFAEKRARRSKQSNQPQVATTEQPSLASMRYAELSAARSLPIDTLAVPRVDTAKMAQPPSVTENTTRLLDDERDSHSLDASR